MVLNYGSSVFGLSQSHSRRKKHKVHCDVFYCSRWKNPDLSIHSVAVHVVCGVVSSITDNSELLDALLELDGRENQAGFADETLAKGWSVLFKQHPVGDLNHLTLQLKNHSLDVDALQSTRCLLQSVLREEDVVCAREFDDWVDISIKQGVSISLIDSDRSQDNEGKGATIKSCWGEPGEFHSVVVAQSGNRSDACWDCDSATVH